VTRTLTRGAIVHGRLPDAAAPVRPASARDLGEAVEIYPSWGHRCGGRGSRRAAVGVTGTAALALGTNGLLWLCALALALTLLARVGPPAGQRTLDEIFDRLLREFDVSAHVGRADSSRAMRLATAGRMSSSVTAGRPTTGGP
jgi:hypothetical protein